MSDVENETPEAEEIEPKKKFRVYKENDKKHLENKGVMETDRYRPSADDLGNLHGEGTYLVSEEDETNAGHKTGTHFFASWTIVTSTKYFTEHWDDES